MAAQIATVEESHFGNVCRIKWTWTSATDGSVVKVTTGGFYGEVISLLTDPGSTAPTDNYDITITDADGYDVMQGAGANRDTANTEQTVPTAKSVAFGPLTLNIATAGDQKTGVTVLLILGARIPTA